MWPDARHSHHGQILVGKVRLGCFQDFISRFNYLSVKAGDTQSWRDPGYNPGPFIPAAKSLTTPSPSLPWTDRGQGSEYRDLLSGTRTMNKYGILNATRLSWTWQYFIMSFPETNMAWTFNPVSVLWKYFGHHQKQSLAKQLAEYLTRLFFLHLFLSYSKPCHHLWFILIISETSWHWRDVCLGVPCTL